MNNTTTIIDRRAREQSEHDIDVEAVNSKEWRALYKKRTPIYPKLVQGPFRTLKWAAMIVLLGIYYLTPWIRWDRPGDAPDQAVLVDFAGRRFYFFFIELWPQEVYYITGLLILASLGIFLSSALFGRVWCGYACPQTVWTDLYIYVERLIEGDRNKRIALDRAPMSAEKAGKKISKHLIWLAIAAATGGAWVFYFGDAPTLFRDIFTGRASMEIYLFIAILTFTTYALAGTMREQVCTYMCPWPRIQAAMTDANTLAVEYRSFRGEPRGGHKKGESWEGRGDCIDCRQCVAVCPQGIDIRDGDQLECINCGLCVDACDGVMRKVGRPTGLIAYDTRKNASLQPGEAPMKHRFVRPRTILYMALFALVGLLMTFTLVTRQTLSIDAMRDRQPPFVRLSNGEVRNNYTVRIINKEDMPRDITLSVSGVDGARIATMTAQGDDSGALHVAARPDAVTTIRFTITAPAQTNPQAPILITAHDAAHGKTAERRAVFVSGAP